MCIFCKIANNEIPSYKIYEDKDFLVFLDLSQLTIGHTLIIPKKHFDSIFDLDETTARNIFVLTVKIANILKDSLNITDLNILNNNGKEAGQSINHFHIHLIPRKTNDNLIIKGISNPLDDQELKALAEKIKSKITIRT